MSCSDCFNGCAGNILPDKCVKYTGEDIDELNIKSGDPLFLVEEKIIMAILNFSIGEGILPQVDAGVICADVMTYLPDLSTANLNDYLTAVIQAACKHGADIATINTKLAALNGTYTIGCLTGITAPDDSDTHKVLQAVITNFCVLQTNVNAINNSLANYVKITDINSYIEAYVNSVAPADAVYQKMIPYVAMEFYDPNALTYFSAGGVGLDLTLSGGKNWTKIYLCNGANGTPDKRGRSAVGVTNMPGGGTLDPEVAPSATNPTYGLNMKHGNNSVTLNTLQLPNHTHPTTVTLTDEGHTHTVTQRYTRRTDFGSDEFIVDVNNNSTSNSPLDVTRISSKTPTGIVIDVVNAPAGGGQPHSNIQPVVACYYIMHIP